MTNIERVAEARYTGSGTMDSLWDESRGGNRWRLNLHQLRESGRDLFGTTLQVITNKTFLYGTLTGLTVAGVRSYAMHLAGGAEASELAAVGIGMVVTAAKEGVTEWFKTKNAAKTAGAALAGAFVGGLASEWGYRTAGNNLGTDDLTAEVIKVTGTAGLAALSNFVKEGAKVFADGDVSSFSLKRTSIQAVISGAVASIATLGFDLAREPIGYEAEVAVSPVEAPAAVEFSEIKPVETAQPVLSSHAELDPVVLADPDSELKPILKLSLSAETAETAAQPVSLQLAAVSSSEPVIVLSSFQDPGSVTLPSPSPSATAVITETPVTGRTFSASRLGIDTISALVVGGASVKIGSRWGKKAAAGAGVLGVLAGFGLGEAISWGAGLGAPETSGPGGIDSRPSGISGPVGSSEIPVAPAASAVRTPEQVMDGIFASSGVKLPEELQDAKYTKIHEIDPLIDSIKTGAIPANAVAPFDANSLEGGLTVANREIIVTGPDNYYLAEINNGNVSSLEGVIEAEVMGKVALTDPALKEILISKAIAGINPGNLPLESLNIDDRNLINALIKLAGTDTSSGEFIPQNGAHKMILEVFQDDPKYKKLFNAAYVSSKWATPGDRFSQAGHPDLFDHNETVKIPDNIAAYRKYYHLAA